MRGHGDSSKFTIAARDKPTVRLCDRIFEEVMRVPGLTAPIYIPTLFIQPEKVSIVKNGNSNDTKPTSSTYKSLNEQSRSSRGFITSTTFKTSPKTL
jgi:hypothetical protein